MARILFVSLESPWPPNRGGRQRSNLLHRALAARGDVDLLLISDNEYSTDELQVMRADFGLLTQVKPTPRGQRGLWRWMRPLHPQRIDRVAHNLGRRAVAYAPDPAVTRWVQQHIDLTRYDLLVARYVFALTRCGLAGRLPTIMDVDDLITSVYRYRLEVAGQHPWQRYMLRRHLHQHERQLPGVFRHCQRLWVANSDDINACQPPQTAGDPEQRVRVLPNIPWRPNGCSIDSTKSPPSPPVAPSPTVITVGSLNYGANLHGVSEFVKHVWPLVRARVPAAEFLIVGNGMTDAMKVEWSKTPGVRPIGLVDDISAWYEQAAIAVAPVFYGGGTNIKVLEAFHFGRTCVVTAQAHRGYGEHLKHRQSLFVGRSPAELAEGCILLLSSPATARQWAAEGGRIIQQHYSWDRFQQIVTQTVDEVLSS